MFDEWFEIAREMHEKYGVEYWRLNRAFVVLQNGGSTRDAEDAMLDIQVRVPATFEAEFLVAQAERKYALINAIDVYPDGGKAWPSNY